MGLLDAARAAIERNMQSSIERDAWWAAYTRRMDAAAQALQRQWAIPTKVPGFWKTPASEARYETAHDPALKALRRRNIDEE